MKIIFLLAIILNSCSVTHKISETEIKELRFGRGGGVSGIEKVYMLKKDGKIIGENGPIIDEISKKEVLELYQEAQKFKNLTYKNPQNIYSYITIISESGENRIVWGIEHASLDDEILKLHTKLMNKIDQ